MRGVTLKNNVPNVESSKPEVCIDAKERSLLRPKWVQVS